MRRSTSSRPASSSRARSTSAPTPTRVPLLNQRWAILPADIPVVETAPQFPGGAQFGARYNHIGSVAEYSFSFYNGYDHLPLYDARLQLNPFAVAVDRFYPQLR